MKNKIYHVGLGKRGKTLVIQACRCIDYLDCEIYDYMGLREVTKAHLRANRYGLLAHMKQSRPDVYGKLRFAVVE